MNKIFNILVLAAIVSLLAAFSASAQITIDQLHGDQTWTMPGTHSGNMIRTCFYNDGMVGDREPDEFGGEWPINSGREYLSKMATLLGAEVEMHNDSTGTSQRQVIVSSSNGSASGDPTNASSGDSDPNTGDWWTFAPLPYFANQFPEADEFGAERDKQVAMSHWKWSWPLSWPDKFDDAGDPGWPGSWNGYFGKNIQNADQESYFVADDYQNREWPFYPDSTNLDRRGLGLRATIRGFQWSNVLVEDCIFFLYDAKNIGTYEHDKMVFGFVAGPNIGSAPGGGDSDDDGGAYILEENLGYQYDEDNIGGGGFTPVGLLGFAFFESPGNPFDGIDNDGDGLDGSGGIITEEMFAPKTLQANDDIILIDYSTFERRVQKLGEGVSFSYLGRKYDIKPGDTVEEIDNDLIDNNLNGIIDESNGSEFGEGEDAIFNYLNVGLRCIDYFSGDGLDNLMIDEERDDGLDNDGDWDIVTDDVGMDGVPKTFDLGEGDGVPTSGAGTELPGEPRIDKTDIDESDMIGLTSFNIHEPWTIYPLSQDQIIWDEAVRPGFLNKNESGGNTDIFMGSGYFPLKPAQIERFSYGMLYADGPLTDELVRNKQYAEKTYVENYNFAKAPDLPTLSVIPGDGQVTLYWDEKAELSQDPITGEDFQGYRIYRSTDPAFTDMQGITDGYGSIAYRKPLVQFDKDDGLTGYAGLDVNGVHFYIGDDTGIVNSWVDTTAVNGTRYFYAVTAFDGGSDSLGIAPTETAKYIAINKGGEIEDKGTNVQVARPEAPANGYSPAQLEGLTLVQGSTATGVMGYEIIDPAFLKDETVYQVVFEDTLGTDENNLQVPVTKNFSFINKTTGDTLINKSTNLEPGAQQDMIDGFRISLFNDSVLMLNADSSMWVLDSTIATLDSAGRAPHLYDFTPFRYSRTYGVAVPNDYRIDFYDSVGVAESDYLEISRTRKLPVTPVNFTVTNLATGEPVRFGFYEADALDGEEGRFTAFCDRTRRDQIILIEPNTVSEDTLSWLFEFNSDSNDSLHRNPGTGDYVILKVDKPFLSQDVFEFQTFKASLDEDAIDLDKIRVVPNPYVVTNSWEPLNPYSSGRGPRQLHFTHLPPQCTIKIFNIRGQLVKEIEHDNSTLTDGTEIWNMLSKDEMDISYGVYVYYVDAGDNGQKIGKFAVIK